MSQEIPKWIVDAYLLILKDGYSTLRITVGEDVYKDIRLGTKWWDGNPGYDYFQGFIDHLNKEK